MKYIFIIMFLLNVVFVNAQGLGNNELMYKEQLSTYMSNYPLSDIHKIYRLSKIYAPAKDSLRSIIQFLDDKIENRNVFSLNDKYKAKSYGVEVDDIVKSGQETKYIQRYVKYNIWSGCVFNLNIASEDLYYSGKKICEKLEQIYCNLSHQERIAYIKNNGQPYRSFIYLLLEGKYGIYKKILEEDFEGILNDSSIDRQMRDIKRFVKHVLVRYGVTSEQEVDTHSTVKKFYLSILKYLEWDSDFVTMKKVLSEIDSDFGSDSDFGKFRAMVAQ